MLVSAGIFLMKNDIEQTLLLILWKFLIILVDPYKDYRRKISR